MSMKTLAVVDRGRRAASVLGYAALAVLGAAPCQGGNLVFAVRNDSPVPWELVDETPRRVPPAYHLALVAPDPVTQQQGPQRVPPGTVRFLLAPGETLTFAAESLPDHGERLRIGLQSGPGSTRAPLAGARLELPMAYPSWTEAKDPHWQAMAENTFRIREDGSFSLDSRSRPSGRPLPEMRNQAPSAGLASSRAAETSRGRKRPVPEEATSLGVQAPASQRARGAGGARKKETGTYPSLTVANGSRQTWHAAVITRPRAQPPAAVLREREGKDFTPPCVAGFSRNRRALEWEYGFSIPPGGELELNVDATMEVKIKDRDKHNPRGAVVWFEERSGGQAFLRFNKLSKALPPADSVLRLQGTRLEILADHWRALAQDPRGSSTTSSLPLLPPLPPPARALPEPPAQARATGTPSLVQALEEPDAGDSPVMDGPRAPGSPYPAGSPGDPPSQAAPVPPPESKGLGHVDALREDLAESRMFLGHDEGQVLARLLGLTVDVHMILEDRSGPRTDDLGRTVIGIRSRFGAGDAPTLRHDGLALLSVQRHYTVLRPAFPAEVARYVTTSGLPCVEITRPGPGSQGSAPRVPVIPSDGHCMIASLHYLGHGEVPSLEQVRAYRRRVADGLAPEVLAALAKEVAEDILKEGRPLLPDGCFAGLGPRFSLALRADPEWSLRYDSQKEAERLLDLGSSWLPEGALDD